MNVNLLGAIFFVILGLFFSLFHKMIGRLTTEFQYKLLHIHFSEKGYQISFIVIGIVFVVFGILSLLGVIKSR